MNNQNNDIANVYMTTDISSEWLIKIYKALDKKLKWKVAVKIHSWEPWWKNFLQPEFMKALINMLDATIVECNTAYEWKRSSTQMHKQVLKDHWFTDIAPTDIMDEKWSISLPVRNWKHLKENLVWASFSNYDSFLILSHFKWHQMWGFWWALKNMSIGVASSEGKTLIHSAGALKDMNKLWDNLAEQDAFLESMAEACSSIIDSLWEENIVYINVLTKLSVDCDCNSNPTTPTMLDIWIMASTDPVALDQAWIDQIYKATDSKELIERIESRNGTRTVDYAEEIWLGNKKYNLINI